MRGFCFLFGFNILLLVSYLGEAKINAASKSVSNGVYIVYMGKSLVNGARRHDHPQLLSEIRKRNKDSVLHTYNKSFLGFAARLSDEEAESIAQRPGVVSVFRDQAAKLHTTRSWEFLTSQNPTFIINGSTIPPVSNFSAAGADTIIGIIDSGIWPEHPSFTDEHMGQLIPRRWKGICMLGENSTNSFKCNNKVIGARYYVDPDEPGYITSARDGHGHGTHTASTAAGVPVSGASYYGLARGVARGGSPGSRIAVYRVCGADGGSVASAILKAIDDAIADGVDVLSVSLGVHWGDLLSDPIAIGAFHAAEKGITVVCSAGNSGPSPGTLVNFVPWILTVGATTIDRDFEANIVLGGRRKNIIKGGGINFSSLSKSPIYHLVDAISAGINRHDITNASNCIPGSLDNGKVKGKIVLCENKDDGDYGTIEKFDMLKSQGAIGMIMIDNIEAEIPFRYGTSPIATVNEEDGARIRSYINSSTSNAMATILPTRSVISNDKPTPVVPFFSSRGPPSYDIQNLIKPDVAAPGLAILAAWRPNDRSVSIPGKKPSLFNIDTGTSMSCPHVSGLAATVKSWHPTWSPSAIRSAIMTTATHTNNQHAPIATDDGSRTTPYDIGAGEISLFDPLCPGLIYEIEATDYVQFLCNMGYNASVIKSISSTVPSNFDCPCNSSPDSISDMNYPSIAISGIKANGSRTVTRTVTNVGEVHSTYTATLEVPTGVQVQVVPKILRFTKTVTKLSFQLTFKLNTPSKEPLFGSVIWSNRNHNVRSPFAVSNA